MASARVDTGAFQDGALPPLCAVTGQPAEVWREVAATRGPSGAWFFFIGFWAVLLMRSPINGLVPFTEDAAATIERRGRKWGRRLLAAIAALVVGAALMMSGVAPELGTFLAFAGLAATIVCWFFFANTPGSVGARVASNPRWVILEPVHQDFADACERENRARSQSR
jgi:hypothetical protein